MHKRPHLQRSGGHSDEPLRLKNQQTVRFIVQFSTSSRRARRHQHNRPHLGPPLQARSDRNDSKIPTRAANAQSTSPTAYAGEGGNRAPYGSNALRQTSCFNTINLTITQCSMKLRLSTQRTSPCSSTRTFLLASGLFVFFKTSTSQQTHRGTRTSFDSNT